MLKDVRNGPQKSPLSHLKSLTSRACDFLFFLKYCFKEQDDFFLNCIYSSNGASKAMYTNYIFQIIILQIFIALYYDDTRIKGF